MTLTTMLVAARREEPERHLRVKSAKHFGRFLVQGGKFEVRDARKPAAAPHSSRRGGGGRQLIPRTCHACHVFSLHAELSSLLSSLCVASLSGRRGWAAFVTALSSICSELVVSLLSYPSLPKVAECTLNAL